MIAALPADDAAVVVAIVAARLLVPLLIPRFPLAIVAAFLLDAVDNGLLDRFTDVDLSADGPYQSWDKALDIYYLSIAYLSTLRNWTSDAAFRIARFLFYYRLAGIVLFELLESRAMLLVFPNTFEFFFIAYEVVRLRYDPARVAPRSWLLVAAGLWVLVKLPQEYWIHIAQRDFTDTVAEHPWLGIACALGVLALLAVLQLVVRPRIPPPAHPWRVRADPPPPAAARRPGRSARAEQVLLLALLCTVFAEILPHIHATPLQVTAGITAIVLANAAISLAAARRAEFAALLAVNLALIFAASAILGDRRDFHLGTGCFFAFLITLILWLYDAYEPIRDTRVRSRSDG